MHKKARAIHGGYMIDKLHDRTKMFLSQIRSEGLGTRTALCYAWVRWFGVLRAFSSSRSVAFRSVPFRSVGWVAAGGSWLHRFCNLFVCQWLHRFCNLCLCQWLHRFCNLFVCQWLRHIYMKIISEN